MNGVTSDDDAYPRPSSWWSAVESRSPSPMNTGHSIRRA